MYYFILLFPFIFFVYDGETHYSLGKLVYLFVFVLSSWILLLIKRHYWSSNFKKPISIMEIMVFGFIGLAAYSALLSEHKITSLFGSMMRYEGLLTIIAYSSLLLFSYRLMDFEKQKKLVIATVLGAIPISLYGILQHFRLEPLPRGRFDFGPSSAGLFGNPNIFGSYLVLVFLMACVVFISQNRGRFVNLYFAVACLIFLSMIFTSTRSAWVGTSVGVVGLTILVVRNRKDLWGRWGNLLASLGLIFMITESAGEGGYLNRLLTTVIEPYNIVTEQATGMEGSGRFIIWKKSLPLIKEYFWFGSGPDTFEYAYPNNDVESKEFFGEVIVDKAHNEYLQIAITMGVPALLVYLGLVGIILVRAFKAARVVDEQPKIVLYGLICVIIGYLVQAFFNISVVTVAPIYWSLLGVTFGISTHYLEAAKGKGEKKKKLTTVKKQQIKAV
ncbi:O-antigen ligase family protein [Bacillus sp. FJAT-27245]|uniref:O-antigen ligase family protein n=1 Tax=Bacillus sp. FJAT-27245 TaxID=1684144 RepID=UPI0006A7C04F|nr:O-antigen ligase family protein [Bacillus sp. FJAT-27245]